MRKEESESKTNTEKKFPLYLNTEEKRHLHTLMLSKYHNKQDQKYIKTTIALFERVPFSVAKEAIKKEIQGEMCEDFIKYYIMIKSYSNSHSKQSFFKLGLSH